MTNARLRLLRTSSALAITAMASTAVAQNETDDGFLGTVILGELQTRTVQESPTSAVVESGEELEARGDVDIYNVIERTPNVSTTFGNKGFVLRGVQTNGAVSNVQLNGTLVSVQVDGVALNNYQSTFFGPYSTWDVDQVEVLRGPQSTQQGRNALAGAVIIKTRDPEFEPELRFRVEGASRNTQKFALSLNQPLTDTLAFRFTAENSSTDGWVTSQPRNDPEYDARTYKAYRGKLRWQPNSRFDAVLEYSYTDSQGGEDYVQENLFPAQRVSLDSAEAVEGSIHRNLGLTTTYEINDWLTLETETNFYDQDYTRLEGDVPPFGTDQSFRDFSSGSETFEQDVQLKFERDRISGVVGLFYTDTKDTRPSRINTDLTAAGLPGVTDFLNEDFSTDVENFAIYAEADVEISSDLTLTVGARYDYETYSYGQSLDFGPVLNNLSIFSGGLAPDIPDIALRTGEASFNAFLPKIGLTFDFTPDQSVSFTLQRGYRAGGSSSNLIETLIPGVDPISNYEPEYSTNYELAYRGSFFEDRLRVGANIFYTDWRDMQISTPGTPTGLPIDALFNFDTVNAAESKLYGFELSFEAEPTANLELFGSVGYTRTKFISFVSGTNDFSGNQFPFAPEWTANIGGKYTWDNGFALALDASYKGASFQDNANTYKDDSRLLLNLHATYDINDQVQAGFYIRNITDEDYATARFQSTSPTIIRTGEPRTVGLYLQATF